MKKKITRILGVTLTLAMLCSLCIVTAPVSAGTQAWSSQAIPSATGLVLDPGNTWTGPFAINKDGTAIYAGSNVGGAGTGSLVKSTNGGRTWTKLSLAPAYTGWPSTITDIVCSSMNANTVYVTDGYDIYKTVDGGTSWTPLSNLMTGGVGAAGMITSIDVGYLGTSPYIFAATSTMGGGGGGAYVCEEAVWGMPWSDLLIDTDRPVAWGGGADVVEVMVDPTNFATTQMVMAVTTDVGANIAKITTKYGGSQWGTTVADITLPGISSFLLSASMWLPADFSSNLASGLMQAFVGTCANSFTDGDVYLVQFGAATAFDLNVAGPGTSSHITGLDGIGGAATASLLATGFTGTVAPAIYTPRVFSSVDGGLTWLPDLKRPSGGQSPFVNGSLSSVLILSSTTALCGTHGTDCGVSITNDFGRTWNGISLLNNDIAAVNDLALGSLFMAANNTGDTVDSIWRHDGTNWERVFTSTIYGAADMVELSANGNAVFAMNAGGTAIWSSTTNGQTWTALVSPVPAAIQSFAALDASKLIVGGVGSVYTSPNGGVIWFTRTCAIGTVQTLVYNAATGDLLAGGTLAGAARVARSKDGGATWTAITAPVPLGVDTVDTAGDVVTNTIVAFSNNYATKNVIFATGTSTADATGNDESGLWKYDYSATTPAWSRIDSVNTATSVVNGVGLVAAPATTGVAGAEMVYAADGSVAGAGVMRVRQPRTVSEQMADTGAAAALNGLWYKAGSNVLYTLAGNVIRTYTDTLNVSGTGVVVSNITATTATVSWNGLANATNYLVVVNPTAQTNFYTAASGAGVVITYTAGATTATISGLTANTTYNASVWASAPVSSYLFGSAAKSFTTLPGAPAWAPVNLLPANGAINQPVKDLAFGWTAPSGGADSYNWELTTDPTFATITEGSKNVTLTLLVWAGPLDYDTSYYWRVQSVTTAGTSPWVISVFTTVTEPVEPVTVEPAPTPIITLPQPTVAITVVPPDVTLPQPTVTVVIPPATQTQTTIELPKAVTPSYIWAIVAIGAVLVIAVIILIIRTRRVV